MWRKESADFIYKTKTGWEGDVVIVGSIKSNVMLKWFEVCNGLTLTLSEEQWLV